jgi:thymidylate kinase
MIKDVIIEGLDRTGKTTQIINLWTHLNNIYPDGCNIIRGDKMNELVVTPAHKYLYAHSINLSFRNMLNVRKYGLNGIRIYDRLHLSEIVYGQKYRKYDTDRIYEIEKEVSELDDVYLILLVDEVDNLIKRDDGLGFTSNADDIKDEYEQFTNAFNDSHIKNKLIININNKNIETVFSEILTFIQEQV